MNGKSLLSIGSSAYKKTILRVPKQENQRSNDRDAVG